MIEGLRPVQTRAKKETDIQQDTTDRKTAYDLWSESHSVQQVATKMGRSVSTIRAWKNQDEWEALYAKNSPQIRLQEYVKARGNQVAEDVLNRLYAIIMYGNDRDSNAAIKTFVGLMGLDQSGPQIAIDNRTQSMNVVNGLVIESPQDVMRVLANISQNRVIDAEVARNEKKR